MTQIRPITWQESINDINNILKGIEFDVSQVKDKIVTLIDFILELEERG